MGETLRVDPARLRAAAEAQADVGRFVSALAPGQSIAAGATGMSGLLTEGACQFAGTMLDTAATAVQEELTTHSVNLSTAADHYHRTDEDLGRRLQKIANDR